MCTRYSKLACAWQRAGVFKSRAASLYLDGRLVGRESVESLAEPSQYPLLIGAEVTAQPVASLFFAGRLDGIKISSDAKYDSDSFTPSRRHLPDRYTELLLNMDDLRVLWLYDESINKAHPQIIGGAMIQAEY